MNLHEAITVAIHEVVDSFGSADLISPTTVARVLQERYGAAKSDPHVQYASLEHFKQMSRRALAGRYSAESDDTEATADDLLPGFSGHLQTRYPVPRASGEDPVYKLRSALTAAERRWNVMTLRSSGRARMLHADALEAEGQTAAAA